MEKALILDAEPLNVLAHATRRGVDASRARAITRAAWEQNAVVCVPAPVLAEVSRGGPADAALDRFLNAQRVRVLPLTRQLAQRAGALLRAHRLDSSHAIDAFVVATASMLGHCVVATHDPDDLSRLAANLPAVRIWRI